MTNENKFQSLHSSLILLVQQERRLTSKILDLLQTVEDDKLYLNSGYANLFEYLVRGLGYSESLAYQRKEALKLCKALPEIKQKIDQGKLSLATLARASRVLNTKKLNEKKVLLQELENKSSRQVDKILAQNFSLERRSMTQTFPCSRAKYGSDSDGNLKVRITLEFSGKEFEQLERLKALKSHQVTDISELVSLLVEKELEKYNRTSRFASKSTNARQIKISLKNHLLQRAKYKCQHPGCEQTHFLQIDHVKPVHLGGGNHPDNLQILCQAHNLYKFRVNKQ